MNRWDEENVTRWECILINIIFVLLTPIFVIPAVALFIRSDINHRKDFLTRNLFMEVLGKGEE